MLNHAGCMPSTAVGVPQGPQKQKDPKSCFLQPKTRGTPDTMVGRILMGQAASL